MEDLEKFFAQRLSLIVDSRALVSGDREETRIIMLELASLLADIKKRVQQQKQELAGWRHQLASAAGCLKLIEASKAKVADCTAKIPPHLLKQEPSPPAATIAAGPRRTSPAETNSTEASAARTKATFPQVSCLTLQEYNSIPKYMKGRAQYDTLNTAVDEMNAAIRTKYTFLARPFTSLASLADKKKWKEFKSQENNDTKAKGLRFITAEELKNSSLLKSESNRRNLLTILRHFQRIREIRGPGSIVRYVAIKK